LLFIYYAIFLVPVIIFDSLSLTKHSFIMVNAYLISTCILAYTWRVSHQRTLLAWLTMQHRLNMDKLELTDFVRSQNVEIEKAEKILAHIISNANDGIVIMDRDGKILKANPSALEMYAQEDSQILGKSVTLIGGENSRQVWSRQLESLKSQESVIFEVQGEDALNTTKYFEVNANKIVIGDEHLIQAFYRDTTERRRMLQEMLFAQKMESAGVMACGISHDFRNVLSTVQGFVDYIRNINVGNTTCPHHGMIEEGVTIIEEEIRKASEVVAQLLRLGEKRKVKYCGFDLIQTIDDICSVFTKIMPSIEIIPQHRVRKCYIYGNKVMVEQALNNIILNAKDSMPEGGRVNILTEFPPLERHGASYSGSGRQKKKLIRVSISDTGTGITEDDLPYIFYPFFTTKSDSSKPGTGLGLTMAYDIVKDHGGMISVDSICGKGTTFYIDIPMMEEIPESGEMTSATEAARG
jgi:two-component system cell cycle sensor histidine kinase/response regulator CckA